MANHPKELNPGSFGRVDFDARRIHKKGVDQYLRPIFLAPRFWLNGSSDSARSARRGQPRTSQAARKCSLIVFLSVILKEIKPCVLSIANLPSIPTSGTIVRSETDCLCRRLKEGRRPPLRSCSPATSDSFTARYLPLPRIVKTPRTHFRTRLCAPLLRSSDLRGDRPFTPGSPGSRSTPPLMILRKRRSRAEVLFETSSEDGRLDLSLTIKDTAPDPEQVCDRKQRRNALLHAVQRLEPQLRLPIEIQMAGCSSLKEIAAALNITVAAVKTRLHRARARLAGRCLSTGRFLSSDTRRGRPRHSPANGEQP